MFAEMNQHQLRSSEGPWGPFPCGCWSGWIVGAGHLGSWTARGNRAGGVGGRGHTRATHRQDQGTYHVKTAQTLSRPQHRALCPAQDPARTHWTEL